MRGLIIIVKKIILVILNRTPRIKLILKKLFLLIGNFLSNKTTIPENIVQVSNNKAEHLFGYYDKIPWNADGNLMIYLETQNSNVNPASDFPATIILHNLVNNSRQKIGESFAWNVQQGCMLQWRGPKYDQEIIYNTFIDGEYKAVIYNIIKKTKRIIDFPVYSVSNDGNVAISLDFSRLNTFRPGYGYINKMDLTANIFCPDSYCIWFINLVSNKITPILKYSDLFEFNHLPSMNGAYHKVNHIMLNPSGKRFIFLHRWIKNGKKYDRMLSCDLDGKNLYDILDEGMVSHSYWLNDSDIITFANTYLQGPQYYYLTDMTQNRKIAFNGEIKEDGHPSLSPNGKFIITDTYPDFKRKQKLYLCSLDNNVVSNIAEIYANPKYKDECRCDLHPRWDRQSSEICFDGAQDDLRQVYILPLFKGGSCD